MFPSLVAGIFRKEEDFAKEGSLARGEVPPGASSPQGVSPPQGCTKNKRRPVPKGVGTGATAEGGMATGRESGSREGKYHGPSLRIPRSVTKGISVRHCGRTASERVSADIFSKPCLT